jgi:hypothetical protein
MIAVVGSSGAWMVMRAAVLWCGETVTLASR